ncbi:MAG: alpha/beta fold hydrolase, partial [Lysobacterales bacterium]
DYADSTLPEPRRGRAPNMPIIRHRKVLSNGIRLRLAEAGPETGPLLLLAHGWPESWYSWRYQIPALAAAGFHVVAPDMRGFGDSDAPREIATYDILNLVEDLAGLLPVCQAEEAVVVGHDWGAVVAWHCALVHPGRFRAVAALSIPHFGRPVDAPTRIWKQRFGDTFYYILYHQQPGVAEAEYEANPRGLLEMLYTSPDTPREPPRITDSGKDAGGWIGRWGRPRTLPAWLSQADLDYYVGEFRRSGFHGGLNYYRNFDRNWEITAQLDQVVRVPALYIAGDQDMAIAHLGLGQLRERMSAVVTDLRGLVWFEGAGHWIQQERHEECNQALLSFLSGL